MQTKPARMGKIKHKKGKNEMKNMRKLFAMVLAVMMVLTLATTAFAEETTYTLTLNNAQEGHTYTAYQIFAGDLSEGTLSNIVWGSGVTADGQTALGDAADKAAALTEDNVAKFAAEVAGYLGTAAGSATVAEGATSCAISNLSAGYYLVQTTVTSEENGVKTYYIMKVVADTSAKIKASVPSVKKTVDDDDVSIGDTVTFTLTATMPNTLEGYDKYKVVFVDTLSAGLTYDKISEVTVAGTAITSGYVAEHENGALTITFADVRTLGANTSSTIVVKYTAIVDSDAVIGAEGNPNKVYLQYSNDPNWDGTGDEPTGKTPEEVVKVYTWQIPVYKYTENDGTKSGLKDAGFKLYAQNSTTPIKFTKAEGDGNIYKVDPNGNVEEILTDDTGKFEIEGLATGTYTLKETTTPAGYNSVADTTVVIVEEDKTEGEVTYKKGDVTVNGKTVTEVEVLNQAGSTLPETGGMGTTLFYVFGGVMVLAAVVLLVTKKRMSAA